MKILHVIDSVFKEGGGTSEVVPRLCEALSSRGNEVRLVTSCGEGPSDAALRAAENGVDVRYCPVLKIPRLSIFRVTRKFRRELENGVAWADVVHVHGHWQNPCWFAIRLAQKMGKRYVMQPHGFLDPERLKISKWSKKVIGTLIERPFLNKAAAVVATAEREVVGLRKYGVKSPIHVVPIGIDYLIYVKSKDDRSFLQKFGLDPNKKTLLYFSRITPIKGLDMLAEAWAKLNALRREWQLLIAGPDDRGYTAAIKELYSHLIKDGSVVFSGPIFGDDKYVLLKSVDAFVLPTRSENFSIAVQEALASGLPVVCTKGAPWQGLEGGEGWGRCGCWVDTSVSGIFSGLREIMSLTDYERMRLGEAGQSFIKQAFGWPSIAKEQEGIYKSVIGEERQDAARL